MAPTANTVGIPTLGGGMQQTPAVSWKDEAGKMRVVVGFGSDSNDRVVGTVRLSQRSRGQDPAHLVVASAAATTGWFMLEDPVYSNADQRGPVAESIAVRLERVAWVIRWSDFQGAHGVADEASRS